MKNSVLGLGIIFSSIIIILRMYVMWNNAVIFASARIPSAEMLRSSTSILSFVNKHFFMQLNIMLHKDILLMYVSFNHESALVLL